MLEKQIEQFVMENRLNYVSEEEAIAPEYEDFACTTLLSGDMGMQMIRCLRN